MMGFELIEQLTRHFRACKDGAYREVRIYIYDKEEKRMVAYAPARIAAKGKRTEIVLSRLS